MPHAVPLHGTTMKESSTPLNEATDVQPNDDDSDFISLSPCSLNEFCSEESDLEDSITKLIDVMDKTDEQKKEEIPTPDSDVEYLGTINENSNAESNFDESVSKLIDELGEFESPSKQMSSFDGEDQQEWTGGQHLPSVDDDNSNYEQSLTKLLEELQGLDQDIHTQGLKRTHSPAAQDISKQGLKRPHSPEFEHPGLQESRPGSSLKSDDVEYLGTFVSPHKLKVGPSGVNILEYKNQNEDLVKQEIITPIKIEQYIEKNVGLKRKIDSDPNEEPPLKRICLNNDFRPPNVLKLEFPNNIGLMSSSLVQQNSSEPPLKRICLNNDFRPPNVLKLEFPNNIGLMSSPVVQQNSSVECSCNANLPSLSFCKETEGPDKITGCEAKFKETDILQESNSGAISIRLNLSVEIPNIEQRTQAEPKIVNLVALESQSRILEPMAEGSQSILHFAPTAVLESTGDCSQSILEFAPTTILESTRDGPQSIFEFAPTALLNSRDFTDLAPKSWNYCSGKNNYNWRLNGANTGKKIKGNQFGRGINFTPLSSYATHYTNDFDGPGNKMILTKVLVGKDCLGRPGIHLPPGDCDTTKKFNNKVICKFDDNTFYPEYIITYSGKLPPMKQGNKNQDEFFIENFPMQGVLQQQQQVFEQQMAQLAVQREVEFLRQQRREQEQELNRQNLEMMRSQQVWDNVLARREKFPEFPHCLNVQIPRNGPFLIHQNHDQFLMYREMRERQIQVEHNHNQFLMEREMRERQMQVEHNHNQFLMDREMREHQMQVERNRILQERMNELELQVRPPQGNVPFVFHGLPRFDIDPPLCGPRKQEQNIRKQEQNIQQTRKTNRQRKNQRKMRRRQEKAKCNKTQGNNLNYWWKGQKK